MRFSEVGVGQCRTIRIVSSQETESTVSVIALPRFSRLGLTVILTLILLGMLALLADSASAQTTAAATMHTTGIPSAAIGNLFKNIGSLLQAGATALYLGVVAFVAITLLPGRKHIEVALFIVVALLVGIMIADGQGLLNAAKSLGHTIFG